MDDLYRHHHYLAADAATRQGQLGQYRNLVTLGRYLVQQADAIAAHGGLVFDPSALPPPDQITQPGGLPPFAHGPLAGLPALPHEDWPGYLARVFRITPGDVFWHWVTSPLWQKTEPSPQGAGLRIAYLLDYGVPQDHIEIAMGQAHTDYDSNGFLWEMLDLVPTPEQSVRLSNWPKWEGAVDQAQKRATITLTAETLIPRLVASGLCREHDITPLPDADLATIEARLGPLPDSYRAILQRIGPGADWLPDGTAGPCDADDLLRLNDDARALMQALGPSPDPVPQEAIFISRQAGRNLSFILPGPRADSPVFQIDSATGTVTRRALSLWGWLEGAVEAAEKARATGPARHPVPAPKPTTQSRPRDWLVLAIGMASLILAAILAFVPLGWF